MNGHFTLSQWNYFNFDGHRTNNHVEGWHARLKRVVGKPHPNIFELVEVIKKEEATTRMKMQICEAGAAQAPRRRRVRENDRKLRALFDRFNSGNITLCEYLEALKHQTGL